MGSDNSLPAVGLIIAVRDDRRAYRVKLKNGFELTSSVARRIRDDLTDLEIGDRVKLELSSFDPSQGRIVGAVE